MVSDVLITVYLLLKYFLELCKAVEHVINPLLGDSYKNKDAVSPRYSRWCAILNT